MGSGDWQGADTQPLIDGVGGVPMSIAGVTQKVLTTRTDEVIASQAASVPIGRAVICRADHGAFPGAVQGAAATLDEPSPGTSYRVVSVIREDNFDRITLARV